VAQAQASVYDDALVAAHGYSADALLAIADAFSATVADPDPGFPGETGRHLASERLRAVRAELIRRERLSRIADGVASPTDRRYEQWRDLARLLRERVDVREVFAAAGYGLHDAGKTEAHAACPVCGGTDRLVIRYGPPGRCWCRRCEWGGDVITVAMSLLRLEFRDALTWLADVAGAATWVPA
jgi:hypothetical protein